MSENSPLPERPVAPPSRPSPRVGDRERHRIVDVLSDAFAAGRLTPEEFEERSSVALAARTAADLDALVVDLPAPQTPRPSGPVASGRGERRLVAVMSGIDRRGRWRVSSGLTVVAVMGGVHLDFRDAVVDTATVSMRAVAVMGGVEIVVPDDWSVSLTGLSIMGGRDVQGRSSSDEPVVHLELSGWAVMGGIQVRHRARAERGR